MNIIRCVFIFYTISAGGLGLLINFVEPYLPILITRTYRYGKYSVKAHQNIVEKLEVPKRLVTTWIYFLWQKIGDKLLQLLKMFFK